MTSRPSPGTGATTALLVCLLLTPPAVLGAEPPAQLPAEPPAAAPQESPVPPEQRRSVEQTFLTYPEWFLVHSPAEYASMVAHRPAHEFPFVRHIGQLWSSYADVTAEQRRQHYPANFGYHVMIGVIASSTTAEYAIRSGYENTVGRISWATASGLTPEDRYGAAAAQDYVDFIRKQPWYLYDFKGRMKGLWTEVPAFGPDMIRKWERRFALSTEYLVKGVYGKAIELATRAAYEPALLTTEVVADREPAQLPADSGIRVLRRLDDGRALLELPRYDAFLPAARWLAEHDVHLVDIAGNTSIILVTAWTASERRFDDGEARVLFEQLIITQPGRKRVALVLPVGRLSEFLAGAARQDIEVEHIYDY
jgi:hypothetical protein